MARDPTRSVLSGAVTLVAAAALAAPAMARQVLLVTNANNNTVGAYHATTGSAINPAFLSQGLNAPYDLATDGNNLFVSNLDGRVGKYDLATGATINPAFVTQPQFPFGLAADRNRLYVASFSNTLAAYQTTTGSVINGVTLPFATPNGLALDGSNHLFVSNFSANPDGTVAEVDATSLALTNLTFVPNGQGLSGPGALALGGQNRLFVVSGSTNTVGVYNATTGATINPAFVTGLTGVGGIAVGGNRLYVVNGNRVSVYDAGSGALVAPDFITGLQGPRRLLYVAPVPEPSTVLLGAAAAAAGAGRWLRGRFAVRRA